MTVAGDGVHRALLVVALLVLIASLLTGTWWTAVAMAFLATGQVYEIRRRRPRSGHRSSHRPS